MVGKITTRTVSSLKPRERQFQVNDTEIKGFCLRVMPSGRMSYACFYRSPVSGKRTTLTIGSTEVFSTSQARDHAKVIVGEVSRGIDPKIKAQKQKADQERQVTLGTFLENDYGPWVTANRRSGGKTLDMIRSVFFEFLDTPLDSLKPEDIEKWKTGRLNDGLSKASLNRYLNGLRSALSHQYKLKNWGDHPLKPVKLYRVDDEEGGRVRFLSENEKQRLLKALDEREREMVEKRERFNQWRAERGHESYPNLTAESFADYLKPMILLSMNTGLRPGEARQIEWRDLTLSTESPSVKIRADICKTEKSRSVALNATALETLKTWQKHPNAGKKFLFENSDGSRILSIKTAWNRLMKRAEIEDFHPNDLRHHFASSLAMKGVPLNTIRELMGHKSIKMTLRYAHLCSTVKAEAVAVLDG